MRNELVIELENHIDNSNEIDSTKLESVIVMIKFSNLVLSIR